MTAMTTKPSDAPLKQESSAPTSPSKLDKNAEKKRKREEDDDEDTEQIPAVLSPSSSPVKRMAPAPVPASATGSQIAEQDKTKTPSPKKEASASPKRPASLPKEPPSEIKPKVDAALSMFGGKKAASSWDDEEEKDREGVKKRKVEEIATPSKNLNLLGNAAGIQPSGLGGFGSGTESDSWVFGSILKKPDADTSDNKLNKDTPTKDDKTPSPPKSVFGSAFLSNNATSKETPSESIFGSTTFGSSSGTFTPFGKAATFGSSDSSDSKKEKQGDAFSSLLASTPATPLKKKAKLGDKATESDHEGDQGDEMPEENELAGEGIKPVMKLETKETSTGEENEKTLFHVLRCKLYHMDETSAWRERGVGQLRLNRSREDNKNVRLVMRTEGVMRLILNVKVIPGMPCDMIQEKYVKFVTCEQSGQLTTFLVKIGNVDTAKDLYDHIKSATPPLETKK